MLTNDRAALLAKYLTDDKERAKVLLELEPQEAAAKINADGYDFTAEELAEFGEQVKAAVVARGEEGEELSEDALNSVSGGVFGTTAYLVAVGVGAGVAYAAAHKIW